MIHAGQFPRPMTIAIRQMPVHVHLTRSGYLESSPHVMWFHISTNIKKKIIIFSKPFQTSDSNYSSALTSPSPKHKEVFRFQIAYRDEEARSRHPISDLLFAAAGKTTWRVLSKKKLLFQTTPIAITILEHLLPPASGGTPSGCQTLLGLPDRSRIMIPDHWQRSTRCQTWLTTCPAWIRMVYLVCAGNIRGITGKSRNKQGNFRGIWRLLSNKHQINYYIYVKKHQIS